MTIEEAISDNTLLLAHEDARTRNEFARKVHLELMRARCLVPEFAVRCNEMTVEGHKDMLARMNGMTDLLDRQIEELLAMKVEEKP